MGRLAGRVRFGHARVVGSTDPNDGLVLHGGEVAEEFEGHSGRRRLCPSSLQVLIVSYARVVREHSKPAGNPRVASCGWSRCL